MAEQIKQKIKWHDFENDHTDVPSHNLRVCSERGTVVYYKGDRIAGFGKSPDRMGWFEIEENAHYSHPTIVHKWCYFPRYGEKENE